MKEENIKTYLISKLIYMLYIVRLDLAKNRLDIGLFIPTIKVEAKYDLKGNLLLLPLVGVGDAKLYLSEYEMDYLKISLINIIFIYY